MNIDVSIVIVCMNNLKNLYPCLESIKKYTTVSYETLVVAYLFSKENLEKVKNDFPWVTFIESNEIRGFSENNNLALRQAKGKYCFVLNDDTFMDMPVIDKLIYRFDELSPEVAILSPNIYNTDGTLQHSGRPSINIIDDMLSAFGFIKWKERNSKYCNQDGLFQSYNIMGAAFMIRKSLFEKNGWFDEKYFFCPEDIALSTSMNKNGFKCMVDSNIRITHIGGGTWSSSIVATKPATIRGLVLFYCDSCISRFIYRIYWTIIYCLYIFYWMIKKNYNFKDKYVVMINANKNALYALWSKKSPKELFIKYYH